jgi:hypothetical protein
MRSACQKSPVIEIAENKSAFGRAAAMIQIKAHSAASSFPCNRGPSGVRGTDE